MTHRLHCFLLDGWKSEIHVSRHCHAVHGSPCTKTRLSYRPIISCPSPDHVLRSDSAVIAIHTIQAFASSSTSPSTSPHTRRRLREPNLPPFVRHCHSTDPSDGQCTRPSSQSSRRHVSSSLKPGRRFRERERVPPPVPDLLCKGSSRSPGNARLRSFTPIRQIRCIIPVQLRICPSTPHRQSIVSGAHHKGLCTLAVRHFCHWSCQQLCPSPIIAGAWIPASSLPG